jgi:hypothetical protein
VFDIYGSQAGTLWIVNRKANNLRIIPMDDYENLSHSMRECKYHDAHIPNCWRKTLRQQLCKYLGEGFRKFASPEECWTEEHANRPMGSPPTT